MKFIIFSLLLLITTKQNVVACSNNPEETVDKNWWKYTLTAAALAPFEFLLSTSIHEGAHALAVVAVGGEVKKFEPYPHTDNDGSFYFGSVTHGILDPKQDALVLAAPMIMDTLILTSYSGLVLSDNLPKNKYAQTALWVFGAGHWFDLVNHLIARNDQTDTRKLEQLLVKENGWADASAKLLVRGTQASIILFSGYFLFQGAKNIIMEKNKKSETPAKRQMSSVFESGTTAEKLKFMDLKITPEFHQKYLGLSLEGKF